ncbi:MAG: glycosyltransferase [Acidobacteriota bacterium]
MSTTFVTGIFRIDDRSLERHLADLDELLASGLPFIVFHDPAIPIPHRTNVVAVPISLSESWTFGRAEAYPVAALPAVRNLEKDTRSYLLLTNAKLDFLSMASDHDLHTSHLAWIDAGILGRVRDRAVFISKLAALNPPTRCLLAPGFWPKLDQEDDQIWSGICWRFAGGFLLGDAQSIRDLHAAYKLAFENALRGGRLTWEVNLWAFMESQGHHIDWYEAQGHDDSLIDVPRYQSLCLNMIVKNESKIIERCLQLALPFIDCWVICDTGSTDDTPARIAAFFAKRNIPGRLVRSPFENFAQARNLALHAAVNSDLCFDYLLMIDADMNLSGTLNKAALSAHAYQIRQVGYGLCYYNTRLVRRDAGSTYIGVTHEYLSQPGGAPTRLDSLWVDDQGDGGSKDNKTPRDIRFLDQGLKDEPHNARYMFYLAQSYRDAGLFDKAIEWYGKRIAAGGWEEEVWAAYYGRAQAHLAAKNDVAFIVGCWVAYKYRPSRAEPLYRLARYYRQRGLNEAAMEVAELGLNIPSTSDSLFVEPEAYDPGVEEEISIAGFYSQGPARRDRGYRACANLTLHHNGSVRSLALRNFTHYARSAEQLFGATVEEIDWKPSNGYAAMNPSICMIDGDRIGIVRTVNYEVSEHGYYPTIDGTGIIKTRNYVVRFDKAWRSIEAWPMEDVTGEAKTNYPVEGFEDCRLFRCGNTWHCSAVVRDVEGGDGRCEQALLTLDAHWRVTSLDVMRDYEHDKHQKNWMPVVSADVSVPTWLYHVHPTVVIERRDGRTTETRRHQSPSGLIDARGGSQLLPFLDGWICLIHEVAWMPRRIYLHRFVRFDSEFRVSGLTEPFYLLNKGIEFAAGLAREGDRFVVSFGVHDSSAHLAFLDVEKVLARLDSLSRCPEPPRLR